MSKERRIPLLGLPLRPAVAAISAVAIVLAFALQDAAPARAVIFGVSIVDPASSGFSNGDFDLSDAQTFPLNDSDGIPGNAGFVIDTFFASVGSTVWIGISAEEGAGPITIDSNDYGTFTEARCNDNNGDDKDFRSPSDDCVATKGLGTDRLVIPDTGNSLDHVPLGGLPRMGIAVAFKCEPKSGLAQILVEQQTLTFDFFIVCHGPLAATQFSATATKLEVWPQPGSTAHSLVRLQLFDKFGGPVAGYEVEWSVDRCAIETEGVDGVADSPGEQPLQEVFEILKGQVSPAETVEPDSEPQRDAERNIVFDFDGNGTLEAIALAVIHCEPLPSVAPAQPGPITIKARITKAGEEPREATFTLNVIGPPAQIFLQASPTRVVCGEKIDVTATVVDAISQPVSDNTPIEFVTNFGGTGTAGAIRGLVAPLSSTVSRTVNGTVHFFLLTSNVNVGNYDVVALSEGIFSTPPVKATVSVSCFLPPTPTSVPAATVVAPSTGTGVTVRPPNTGDGGLR